MKRFISVMLTLPCLVTLSLGCSQVEASQKSRSHKLLLQAKFSDDIEKRREELHRLVLNGKYHREDVAELLEVGNRTSIPVLLEVLKDNPAFVRANGRVVFPLAAIYAIEALRKITSLNMGTSYREWSEWWEESKEYYLAPAFGP